MRITGFFSISTPEKITFFIFFLDESLLTDYNQVHNYLKFQSDYLMNTLTLNLLTVAVRLVVVVVVDVWTPTVWEG